MFKTHLKCFLISSLFLLGTSLPLYSKSESAPTNDQNDKMAGMLLAQADAAGTNLEPGSDAAPSDASDTSSASDTSQSDSMAAVDTGMVEPVAAVEEPVSEEAITDPTWQDKINDVFGAINAPFEAVLFSDIVKIPPLVIWIVLGGLFFTFRYKFVNIRLFKHAINVTRGKYDNPNDEGEISHFQALSAALSATVGLGNIAGVAVAIALGGPGAVFWLWMTALLGMSLKFTECSLGILFRKVDDTGHVLGGPMMYLSQGLKNMGFGGLGKVLAVMFAILCIGGSLGGGNMFQANQTYELLSGQFEFIDGHPFIVGFILAVMVAVVIIGGIKRIGEVAGKLVPAMCLFYVGCCLAIIIAQIGDVPAMFASIFKSAFAPEPIYAGGFIGILIQGVKRASFSNEAGMGSASIAHSAAKTDEPMREGIVALLEPFIDTIVVCTMTSLAILLTSAHLDPELAGKGGQITAKAFSSLGDIFPILLTIAACIFAYSTVISWSYYGERAVEYLFGKGGIVPYRIIYVCIIVVGPALTLGNVIGFSDIMLLSMSIPNILGMYFLASYLNGQLQDYLARYRAGEFKVYK